MFLLLSFFLACGQRNETEKLITSAEPAEREGKTRAAADLYHRVVRLNPEDFETQYPGGLLYSRVDNVYEAEEHLKMALAFIDGQMSCRAHPGVYK